MKKQSQLNVVWLLALSTIFSLTGRAVGNEVPAALLVENADPLAKINPVSELAGIQPTDWAFQSLKSLMDRYGVVAPGYLDSALRGNRAMSRYEFAASLAASMNRISELTTAETANRAHQEDLETLKRLQAEFDRELEVLQPRLHNLETSIGYRIQPFSTTTELEGEVLLPSLELAAVKQLITAAMPPTVILPLAIGHALPSIRASLEKTASEFAYKLAISLE